MRRDTMYEGWPDSNARLFPPFLRWGSIGFERGEEKRVCVSLAGFRLGRCDRMFCVFIGMVFGVGQVPRVCMSVCLCD
jgi:hypothetical protein